MTAAASTTPTVLDNAAESGGPLDSAHPSSGRSPSTVPRPSSPGAGDATASSKIPSLTSTDLIRLPRHRLTSPVPSSVYCQRCSHLCVATHVLHRSLASSHYPCSARTEEERILLPNLPTSPHHPSDTLHCTSIGCEDQLIVADASPPALARLHQLPVRCLNAVYGCPACPSLPRLQRHEDSCSFAEDEGQLRSSFPSLCPMESTPAAPLASLVRLLSILPRCGLHLTRPPPTSYTYVRLQALLRDGFHTSAAELSATYALDSSTSPPSCSCRLSFRGLTATAAAARKAQAQDTAASGLLSELYRHPLYRQHFLLPIPAVDGANAKSALVNLLRGHSVGKGVGVAYRYQAVVEEGEAVAGNQCFVQYGGWEVGWGVGGRKREACEAASRDALRQLHAAREVVAQFGEEVESDMKRWWEARQRTSPLLSCAAPSPRVGGQPGD